VMVSGEVSDIYAAGLIAYELFTGEFPYRKGEFVDLVQDIAYRVPDYTPFDLLDSTLDNDRLAITIARMLEKNPADRYKDTTDVLNDLYALRGSRDDSNMIEMRESFLQTAALIGREDELQQLTDALKLTFEHRGSVWLIGGEAGIGKSRLTEEMRVRSLVRGALVLRGQAVAEASSAYQLWRGVLRRIILEVELTPLEASVLKPLISDIGRLLGRDVDSPPDIGAVASFNRLLTTITEIFLRYDKPLVIILEDLHWSQEGLTVLQQISSLVEKNPILILGTYRTDERPGLPSELPNATPLVLNKLSQRAITALTRAFVGDNGNQKQVVDMLQRETQGNVLFIIEVMRALYDETGSLENIGLMTLPRSMFGGGVRQVIRHRMRHLPDELMPLMEMGAILGKVIDIEAMNHLYGTDTVQDWLQQGSDSLVLAVQNEQWRFAHNTIRDTIIEGIEDTRRGSVHQKAAEAIEAVYDAKEQAPRLGYHWAKVGDAEREAYYKAIAAETSYRNGAFEEASDYFERLIELYETALPETPENHIINARYRRRLGTCYFEIGRLEKAMETLVASIGELSTPVPQSKLGIGLGMTWQILRQVWHRLSPFGARQTQSTDAERLEETALACNQIAEMVLTFQQGDPLMGLYASVRGLNLADKIGVSVPRAYSLGGISWLMAATGQKVLSKTYLSLAHEMFEQDVPDRAIPVGMFTMGLVYAGWGQWEEAQALATKCLQTANQNGDWRAWRQASGLNGDIAHFKGDYSTAIEYYKGAHASSERIRDFTQIALQKSIWARSLFMLGDYTGAKQLADEAIALDDKSSMVLVNRDAVGIMYAHYEQDWETLELFVRQFLESANESPIKIYVQYDGYVAAADGALALLAHFPQKPELRILAETTCKALDAFANVYPLAKARSLLCEARLAHLTGTDKAHCMADMEEAVAHAQSLSMRYEEALAKMYLGHLSEDNTHLDSASTIFADLDIQWGLEQLMRLSPKS
ncbi:MAG: AAA family ATPase, partial [Chloroflexota bacterium]